LDSINLTLRYGDEFIPENILGYKKTAKLEINYEDNVCQDQFSLLKVNENAFQNTENCVESLELRNFDSSHLDFAFLSGFRKLTSLKLFKIHHIQKRLPTLPPLPKLTALELSNIRGINESIVTFPTLSTDGLKRFIFKNYNEKGTDGLVSRMLDWILLSSAKNLEYMALHNIGITQITSKISSFRALKYLHLEENSITTIKNGALSFSVPVLELRLSNNNISSIEPGAFQGKYIIKVFYVTLIHALLRYYQIVVLGHFNVSCIL